jgi:UPF0042 nucleotide-binding protein
LKRLTGNHAAVVRYLRREKETISLLSRLGSFVGWLLPRYVREGKSYLTVAIGCTGGRHRSVMVANALGAALKDRGYAIRVYHRDMKQG